MKSNKIKNKIKMNQLSKMNNKSKVNFNKMQK